MVCCNMITLYIVWYILVNVPTLKVDKICAIIKKRPVVLFHHHTKNKSFCREEVKFQCCQLEKVLADCGTSEFKICFSKVPECTNLRSLFSVAQILREITFRDSRISKTVFFALLGLWILLILLISAFKMCKNS